MKINKMPKRVLLGLCVLALVFVVPTHAATKMCNESSPSEVDVKERYGLSFTHVSGDKFKLKMNPKTNKTSRCKMKFKVTEINSHASGVSEELSCDHDVELTISDRTDDTDYGLPGVLVKIETTKEVKKNENESNSCYYTKGTVTFEKTVGISSETRADDCPEPVKTGDAVSTPEIDCDKNTYEEGSFEYKFCYAKKKASGNTKYDFTGKGGTYSKYTGSEKLPDFTCNYDVNTVPLEPEKLKGEDYYVNKNYIYGSNTTTETNGKYQYYYQPGHATEGDAVSCKITCEEAVEVEYGPPVASKAGMCFEYKVRVTSRVTCNMSEAPKPPKHDCNVCTPTPSCSGSSGKVWRQGGPNEDFDACVQSCDGGQYTTKCSNQCYKEVYGTTTKSTKSAKKQSTTNVEELAATKVAEAYDGSLSACLKLNPAGCYTGTGSFEWHKGSQPIRGGEGRWYSEHPGGTYHNGQYVLDNRGFWRHQYADGSICHDTCTWGGCSDTQYINPGMAAKDYEKNAAKYYEAINICKAKAICNTTTSEYTITADYKRDGETISINFPYDSKKDHLKHVPSSETKVDDTLDQANTTLLPDDVEEGQGILGCYKRKASEENLYRSTWGFPGTWINGKTGEISYEPGSKSSSWREYPDKFCIPSDAERVNEEWWNAFYNRKMKEQASSQGTKWSVFDSTEVNSKCESSKTNTVADPTPVTNEDIKWNIRAHAEDFGYFEWDINMKCFYALNPKPTTNVSEGDTNTSAKKSCDPEETNYRVRSINLQNMFPDSSGGELSPQAAEAGETGRDPGYNWSEFATNTKNPDYVSKPKEIIARIQKEGYGVYSDQYLDYEFELTPSIIRSMRAQSSQAGYTGSNYTNFDNNEFKVDSKGVSRYYSNKIRSGIGLKKAPASRSELENNNLREG